MLTALTRAVSPCINNAELEFLTRQPIHLKKAIQQHQNYEKYLRDSGINVISLPAQPELPDAVFVEDPAVVVDEIAVITTMGSEARSLEVESITSPLAAFRTLEYLTPPAKLEGGDVLRVGRTLFVGESSRTNRQGIAQLTEILSPYSYEVVPVKVKSCLHLKTGCTYLGRNTILINPNWVDHAPFINFKIVEIPPEEDWAANILLIKDKILLPSSFPETYSLLTRLGFIVDTIDISELLKAEAGLTCMSIIFNNKKSDSNNEF